MVTQAEQRELARLKANEIRRARKEIKARLACGQLELAALISHPPEEALSAPIGDVLTWMHGIGRYRSDKITKGICRPTLHLADMGDYTRRRIASKVDEQLYGPAA